ncbi:hypothetical protein JW826_01980, partial [Candidatus Woesearchaeota archaeon]|nr:hypothetical protein [Candidatus Woesearchaeota archaeon]
EFELPPGNESDLGKDYWYALKQSFWLAYPGADLNSTCRAKNGFEYPCVKGNEPGNLSARLLNLYLDKDSGIVVFSDRDVPGLISVSQNYICDWFPSWLKWLCPDPPPISRSLRNLTFDRLYAARMNNREILGVSKERCECIGCGKNLTYSFEYYGFGMVDLFAFLGTPELYVGEEFSMIESGVKRVSVLVRDPKKLDKESLWNALAFLKGS